MNERSSCLTTFKIKMNLNNSAQSNSCKAWDTANHIPILQKKKKFTAWYKFWFNDGVNVPKLKQNVKQQRSVKLKIFLDKKIPLQTSSPQYSFKLFQETDDNLARKKIMFSTESVRLTILYYEDARSYN